MGNMENLNKKSLWYMFNRWILKEEQKHIRTVFHHKNNYKFWLINNVIDNAKKVPSADQNDSSNNGEIHHLKLP